MRLLPERWHLKLALALAALVVVIYLIHVPRDPPGFCLDESSIAYNAHLIATTGHDEYGEAWPLFFRAFGEFKNPIFIYLLAGVFKITGPSIAVARSVSAILGVIAVLLIGYLGSAVSERKDVGIAVGLSTALTPWLYENSRLVFEVALYPVLIAVFLIAVFRASKHERWSLLDILSLMLALALLTYAYSIGRLLGPLLALGLVLFAKRKAYREILFVWLGYALTLIPLFVFNRHHPGSLTARFSAISFIQPNATAGEIVRQFIVQYARDISPIRLLLKGGDDLRDHLTGTGSILFVTFVLAIAGVALIIRRRQMNSWWLYVIYAFAVGVIPAALTTTNFPPTRLIMMPVIINVLSIPAWKFLFDRVQFGENSKRLAMSLLILSLLAIAVQGIYFQVLYHQKAPEHGYICDEKFPRKILSVALAGLKSPIYLLDPPGKSGYVQSYWHGLLGGIDRSRFMRVADAGAAPPASVVISTEDACANCRLLARHLNFIVYTPLPSEVQPRVAALADEGFRAEIKLAAPLPSFRTQQPQQVIVLVRNVSTATWPSVGADDGRYRMTVRGRWLKPDGTIVSTGNAVQIAYGLDPGDVTGVNLPVVAPDAPGDYRLLIDVVQEGVSWFSDKGSKPLVIKVSVTP